MEENKTPEMNAGNTDDLLAKASGMSKEELLDWMQSVKSSNAGQEEYAKKQFTMAMIGAAANVAVLVIVVVLAMIFTPKINKAVNQVNEVMEEADEVMENLQNVTSQLAEIDYSETINSVNGLVESSEESVSAALDKINAMDISTLNKAIKDLEAVVSPLARLFGGGK